MLTSVTGTGFIRGEREPITARRLCLPGPLARSFLGLAIALCVAVANLSWAAGEPAEAITEPVVTGGTGDVRFGAFLLSGINVRLQLETPNGEAGSRINLAETLGGETTANTVRLDGTWTISGPHAVDVAWYDINLHGLRTLSTEFKYGDTVYPVNAEVESQYRTTIYKVAYAYTFRHSEQHEFAALAGLHVMDLETSVAMQQRGEVERFGITAPMPAIGAQWKAHWSERFTTRASFQWFGISVDDSKYSGHFTDLLFAAEYQMAKWGGLGAGYNRFDLNVKFRSGDRTLDTRYSYGGLLVYVFARF